MALHHAHSRRRSKLVVVGIVLAGGIVLSVMAYHFVARSERELRRVELIEQADLRIRALGQRLRRAMSTNMAPITRLQKDDRDRQTMFRDLAEARLSSNDDIQTLMWVPRVPIEDLEAHVQAAHDQGLSDYRVHPHIEAADPRSGDCFPVFFVEPQADNLTTLGLDLGTVPQLRLAIERAINNGGTAVSHPVLWRDDTGKSLTVFVFRALHRQRRAPDIPDTSHHRLLGFAVTIVRAGAMIEDALSPFEPKIDIVVSGSVNGESPEPLLVYDSKTKRALPIDPDSKLRTSDMATTPTRQITLPGRKWSAYGRSTEAFRNQQQSAVPILILLVGLLITGIITAYLNTVLGRNAKIEELVVRRTAQLEEANEESLPRTISPGHPVEPVPRFHLFQRSGQPLSADQPCPG
jgi:CHASE1-domain containing sensor protein